ncbi:glycosyltransferase family 39 protein [Actinomadura atramentaria]|uniref:glycosyltransferase family 39 protein n=1 Tax=Actinomadura atramentaria TaxID=1990 RepID=UPI00035E5A26|nr:glycosyltransferase family 39 protein [Actinomadura atramentaria]
MTATLRRGAPARPSPGRRARLARLARGAPRDPVWARPALAVLLAAMAALYLWDLGASGWANAFYAAAAQAGSQDWTAFFFGSSDAGNAITVDKTPGALWPMALSARLFGVNPWSLLVPQALMGVASVGVLYASVRRVLGGTRASVLPALAAGAALATTPVAALMFRFDNPDALLVLLLVAAAYALLRACEDERARWVVACGALVGCGFMAKMLQAFLVVPVFAAVYLAAGPGRARGRVGRLVAGGAALVVAAGWWVAAVALVPSGSRPYIGGSQHDSVLELALGYNGLGRLSGAETGGLGNTDQDAGWARMFGPAVGGQVSWLVPGALVLLAAGLWAVRGASRTDRVRAALALWGGWLLVTGGVFSLMRGIFHEYYTVALAPAVAALVGIGGAAVWERRRSPHAAGAAAVAVAATAAWAWVLLGRTPEWHPWLRPLTAVAGTAAALALAVALPRTAGGTGAGRGARWGAAAGAALAAVACLAGPVAYAVQTAATPHSGSIVTAGPATGGGFGGFGPRAGGGGRGGFGGGPGGAPGGGQRGGPGAAFGGGPPGVQPGVQPGGRPGGAGAGQGGRAGGRGGPGGFGGGLLSAATPDARVTALLRRDASSFRWAAAVVGSNNAAGYQLASGRPVMAVGGFNGTDPAPTLAEFKRLVAAGRVHYFVGGSGTAGRASSGSDAARSIAEWVERSFTARTVAGTTLYDLTAS